MLFSNYSYLNALLHYSITATTYFSYIHCLPKSLFTNIVMLVQKKIQFDILLDSFLVIKGSGLWLVAFDSV